MIIRSFSYSINIHCPTCSNPIRLHILTGFSHFLINFEGSSILSASVFHR